MKRPLFISWMCDCFWSSLLPINSWNIYPREYFSHLRTNGGIKSFQLVQHTRHYLLRKNSFLVLEHLYVTITFTIRTLFNPPTSAINAINSTVLPVFIIIMQFLPNTYILAWESKSDVLSPNSSKLITIQRAYDILKYRSWDGFGLFGESQPSSCITSWDNETSGCDIAPMLVMEMITGPSNLELSLAFFIVISYLGASRDNRTQTP